MRSPQLPNSGSNEFQEQISILTTLVGIMWGVELLDSLFLNNYLNNFGIHPRTLWGLTGIFLCPFLHGGLPHLIANTVPFLTLGWFVMLRRTSDFWVVTATSMIIGGLGVWLVGGSNTVHIGASGLVFGYLGFLLLRGYFERSLSSIFLSLLILFLYGGLIWGVLPLQRGVSWEAHLFGFIGGVIAARQLARPVR